jgi:hypothetical protein
LAHRFTHIAIVRARQIKVPQRASADLCSQGT